MNLEELLETNKRLNRRCQELERLLAEKDKRFCGMTKLLIDHVEKAKEYYQQMRHLRDREHIKSYKGCLVCRFNRALRHTFVSPEAWVGNKKKSFWRFLKDEIVDYYR